MRKILTLIICFSFFSCDQLLQRKQMYSVEITSCLFKDDDFNRSEITGGPLPITMELYEEGYLIWEVDLGKHRGAFKYDNSKVEDNVYVSKDHSTLSGTIPEFIQNNADISSKIISLNTASEKKGGKGALIIKLKKIKV